MSRIRVLSINTFGTLLGALRRPPRRIGFVLTAARMRGLPSAVLSHYRHFSFGHVSPRSVTGELSCMTSGRGVSLAPRTTVLVSHVTSNTLHSTLSLLSEYTSCKARVARGITDSTTNVTNERRLFRLISTMVSRSDPGTLAVVSRLCGGSYSVRHLLDRLLSRFHGVVITLAIPGFERLIVYPSSRVRVVHHRTGDLALRDILSYVSEVNSTVIRVGEKTSEHADTRVTIVELADPGLSASATTILHEVSSVRMGLGGNIFGPSLRSLRSSFTTGTSPIGRDRPGRTRARRIGGRGPRDGRTISSGAPTTCSRPGGTRPGMGRASRSGGQRVGSSRIFRG